MRPTYDTGQASTVDSEALGALLALLHDADERLPSVCAEYRIWLKPNPTNTVVIQAGKRARWVEGGPFSRASETRRLIWYEPQNRIRVEAWRGRKLLVAAVRLGDHWCLWDEANGRQKGTRTAANDFLPPILNPLLLFPGFLLGQVRFRPNGTDQIAGRRAITARADRRHVTARTAGGQLDFAFDGSYGIVLRRAEFLNGACLSLTEALAVTFGVPVPRHRLMFDTVPGRAIAVDD